MNTKSHRLFNQYPLTDEAKISIGRVPVPYHTYDGHGLFIGGTANLAYVTEQLQDQDVYPIPTEDGKAVMGIWVVDFTDASLGAHTELQLSILVSHHPAAPIENHSLTLLKALFTNADARMFCYRLWNNTDVVVAYNTELLGLNAQLSRSSIERENGVKTFKFTDIDHHLTLEGQVHEEQRTSSQVGWQLLRLVGLRHMFQLFSQPYLGAKVVNPISDSVPYNGDAQSYVAADSPVVQWWNNKTDSITFGQEQMANLNFQPQFIEHFEPFRFVYLQPEKVIPKAR